MAKIEQAMVQDWRARASEYLAGRGYTLDDVKTGSDAWVVAHAIKATNEAYDISRDITDAHIKTVLAKIFPNAVFKDKYRY